MEKMCPYIEKRTIIKTMINYSDDMVENGSIQLFEREMMKCDKSCMRYENGRCTYNEKYNAGREE